MSGHLTLLGVLSGRRRAETALTTHTAEGRSPRSLISRNPVSLRGLPRRTSTLLGLAVDEGYTRDAFILFVGQNWLWSVMWYLREAYFGYRIVPV